MRLAMSLAVLLVAGSAAQAVEDDVAVKITARRPCWTYHGAAVTFAATLAAKQHVTVRMRGEVVENDPKTHRDITKVDDRYPDVSGPENFRQGGDAPELAFVTPHAGRYVFGFSPNAMMGLPGDVEICAREH